MTLAIVTTDLRAAPTAIVVDEPPPFAGLRLIEAACRHRNYTQAARECGVSHPAITAQVQKLEARLGAPLFNRENLRMQPTPAALNLARAYREARAVLEAAVRRSTAARPVSLLVGTNSDFARLWLAPRLGEIMAALPGVALEFRCLAPDPAGPWEAYIGQGSELRQDLACAALIRQSLQVFCRPALARERALREPLDLVGTPLLQRRPGDWSLWFGSLGLPLAEPFLSMTFDEVAEMIDAAALGAGVALAPAGMAEGALRAGRLVRLFDHEIVDGKPLVLSWRAGSVKLDAIERLRRWLAEELRAGRRKVGAARRGCLAISA